MNDPQKTPAAPAGKLLVKMFLLLATVLTAGTFGCTSIEPGQRASGVNLDTLKTAHIVRYGDDDHEISADIRAALEQRGVTATPGTMADKPAAADFFVKYGDHWRWDMAMYLFSLKIEFFNNADGKLIGTGTFGPVAFHGFPNATGKVREVVDSI